VPEGESMRATFGQENNNVTWTVTKHGRNSPVQSVDVFGPIVYILLASPSLLLTLGEPNG
jgi:hypothetical protein